MKKETFDLYCPSCGTKNRVRKDLAALDKLKVECGNCHSQIPFVFTENNTEEETENPIPKIPLLIKILIVTAVLMIVRFSLQFISNDYLRFSLVLGVILAFSSIQFLRKIFFQISLFALLLTISLYVTMHITEIRKGKISFKQAVYEISGYLVSYGPVKEFKDILFNTFMGRYLSKIDPRNETINELASRLTKPCRDNDHLCEVSMILKYVTNEISYREDPNPQSGGDYIKTPIETLKSKSGDCEDQTILLLSLLESIGKKTYMVFAYRHAYGLICFQKQLKDLLPGDMEYARTFLPNGDLSVIDRFSSNHHLLEIDKKFCYELEPTARNSWIGYPHNLKELKFVFDSVTKEEVRIKVKK